MKDFFELRENYRTLARAGMGTESKGEARVGLELDYYDGSGSKRMGKITKVTSKGYIVKDDKDGKNRQFTFHDRVKAKEILARIGKGKYNESVDVDESVKTEDKGQFIYAAKQAKAKGDSTFVFAGKTYNCEEVLENEDLDEAVNMGPWNRGAINKAMGKAGIKGKMAKDFIAALRVSGTVDEK